MVRAKLEENGVEIKENFDRDFIRELREMLGAKND